MRLPLPTILIPLVGGLAVALPAQTGELLRFDEGCGPDTLAYPLGVSNGSAYPRQIAAQPSPGWAPGRWGSALRGCDDPTVTGGRSTVNYVGAANRTTGGDLTMVFWIRQRHAVTRRQQLVLGQPFVQLLADQPNGALEVVFSQPTFTVLRTQTNVFALAASRWVQVALVHDAANLTLKLYVEGSLEASASLAAPAVFSSSWEVGHRGGTLGTCYYDIDEFFSDGRALTMGELQTLRSFPLTAVGEFTGGCFSGQHQLKLQWIGNTAPSFGATGTIRTTGQGTGFSLPPGTAVALSFGDDRCQYRGLQLPFNLGTVFSSLPFCTLVHNQNLLMVSTAVGASGTFDIPLTVPAGAATLPLYAQAFAIETNGTLRISNGLALAIGG